MKINNKKTIHSFNETSEETSPGPLSRRWLTHSENQLSVTTLQVIAQIRAATKKNPSQE